MVREAHPAAHVVETGAARLTITSEIDVVPRRDEHGLGIEDVAVGGERTTASGRTVEPEVSRNERDVVPHRFPRVDRVGGQQIGDGQAPASTPRSQRAPGSVAGTDRITTALASTSVDDVLVVSSAQCAKSVRGGLMQHRRGLAPRIQGPARSGDSTDRRPAPRRRRRDPHPPRTQTVAGTFVDLPPGADRFDRLPGDPCPLLVVMALWNIFGESAHHGPPGSGAASLAQSPGLYAARPAPVDGRRARTSRERFGLESVIRRCLSTARRSRWVIRSHAMFGWSWSPHHLKLPLFRANFRCC